MSGRLTLDRLYARFDAIAEGKEPAAGSNAHAAVLDRLTENLESAERRGWVSCSIERASGMGRLIAWGLPPASSERQVIPDWSSEPG